MACHVAWRCGKQCVGQVACLRADTHSHPHVYIGEDISQRL